jgi:ribonuclease PH
VAKKKKAEEPRFDGRRPDELRRITFERDIAPAAPGSVLVCFGDTRVICSAQVEDTIPAWMRAKNLEEGWLTAEYSLMPCSTSPRSRREVTAGKIGGRTQEIQRLIGRSLRAVLDMKKLGKRTVWLDCDVLQADGGTRTAAITGAYVALRLAVDGLIKQGKLQESPILDGLAAVSVGVVDGRPVLDLPYAEDCGAEVDMNVVMTASNKYVEVQGSAEGAPFNARRLQQMLKLAHGGIREIIEKQEKFLAGRKK